MHPSHFRTSPIARAETSNVWTDEWTRLDDRKADPPKQLPVLESKKRVVLVRHGQSTWNSIGRMQGSSNFSVLTEKGKNQAKRTSEFLADQEFDVIYQSPLGRALETADHIVSRAGNERMCPRKTLPTLREIDLYGFQGLNRSEAAMVYAYEYEVFRNFPHEWKLDGHIPVKELWYRASLAWEYVLGSGSNEKDILVVAHNAINQAMIAVACGLPPSYFRRLAQDNAAMTILEFDPEINMNSQKMSINRINQSPTGYNKFMPLDDGQSRIIILDSSASSKKDALSTAIEELIPDIRGNSRIQFLALDESVETTGMKAMFEELTMRSFRKIGNNPRTAKSSLLLNQDLDYILIGRNEYTKDVILQLMGISATSIDFAPKCATLLTFDGTAVSLRAHVGLQ